MIHGEKIGGRDRDRTGDPLLAKQWVKNHISFVWRRFQTRDRHFFSLTCTHRIGAASESPPILIIFSLGRSYGIATASIICT
jgi:hypothetical protein